MKRAGIAAALTIAVIATVSVPFMHAQTGPRSRVALSGIKADGFGPFAKLRWMKNDLGLSDAQAMQIRAIVEGVREENAPYRETMQGTVEEAALLLLDNPNATAAAQAVFQREAAAEREIRENVLQGFADAFAVLTPAQRQKLSVFIAQHEPRF